MGRIILLLVILFALYWAREYYNARKEKKPKVPSKNEVETVDELISYYNGKIEEIESKSMEEIRTSEDTLKIYKEQLEKLNKIKNKQ